MYNNYKMVPWVRYALSAVAIILFSAAYAGTSRFNFLKNKTRTTFNFTIVENLIIIPVKINGIDLNLILDSGMRSIVLFERDFKGKIKTLDNYEVKLSGYGKRKNLPSKLSLDNEILIADVLGSKVPVVIMPEAKALKKALMHIDVDGIIGYEIFSRFIVKIDYPKRMITLHEPFDNPENYNYNVLPLIVKDTKPYIQARIELEDGTLIEGQFHLDTGSYHDVMLFATQDLQYRLKEVNYTILGVGIGGKIKGFTGTESTLKLGDLIRKVQPKCIERQFSNRELQDAKGSIGSGFLKDSIIVLDYIHMKFYLQKEPVTINQFSMASIDI